MVGTDVVSLELHFSTSGDGNVSVVKIIVGDDKDMNIG